MTPPLFKSPFSLPSFAPKKSSWKKSAKITKSLPTNSSPWEKRSRTSKLNNVTTPFKSVTSKTRPAPSLTSEPDPLPLPQELPNQHPQQSQNPNPSTKEMPPKTSTPTPPRNLKAKKERRKRAPTPPTRMWLPPLLLPRPRLHQRSPRTFRWHREDFSLPAPPPPPFQRQNNGL